METQVHVADITIPALPVLKKASVSESFGPSSAASAEFISVPLVLVRVKRKVKRIR